MSSIASLNDLFVNELRDILDAERNVTKALPKMIDAAESKELAEAFTNHLAETEMQISRLEQAFEMLGLEPRAKKCAGMRGILEEGKEHMSEDFEDNDLRDAVMIAGAQKVEHYEIATYGTIMTWARLLGHEDIVEVLKDSIAEEKAADEKLTAIAKSMVNLEALDSSDSDDEEESEGETSRASTSKRRSGSNMPARAKRKGGSRSKT